MSPITHGMIGWIISQPLPNRRDRQLVTLVSVLPDLDGLGFFVNLDYYLRFHHTFGHNIFFGIILSFLAYRFGLDRFKVSILVFISFVSHIIGDLLGSGSGWGIPLFWPLLKTEYEFSSPYQWELSSWQNLAVTAICIGVLIGFGLAKNRTIVEVISTKADEKVVSVLRGWFL